MGKIAKGSRKGKKAWRANISTEDIDDFFEKSTKDALSGGSLTNLPSESLFYVDKSRDLSVKRKIEKKREKVLRCDSMLQKNPFVQAVPSSTRKKSSKKNEDKKTSNDVKDSVQDVSASASVMVDLWQDENEGKTKKKFKPSLIPAVEVEPPGCSFNPTADSHQDSLARAVADEMQKVYKDELGPEPVPLTVQGEVIDDEDRYFLDADDGSDGENMDNDMPVEPENRSVKTKPVTRVELNKRARHKELLRKEAAAIKKARISKEIDGISEILQEISKEDEEKAKRHIRRVTAKQERLKSCPPRLGKHKFEPAPMQVLLSEEITGSIRKLKGCCTLAKDRFKSLEKRGLIVPTKSKRR